MGTARKRYWRWKRQRAGRPEYTSRPNRAEMDRRLRSQLSPFVRFERCAVCFRTDVAERYCWVQPDRVTGRAAVGEERHVLAARVGNAVRSDVLIGEVAAVEVRDRLGIVGEPGQRSLRRHLLDYR